MDVKRSRLLLLALPALLLAAGSSVTVPSRAGAAPAPRCAVAWGSLDRTAGPSTRPSSQVRNVRTGRHACFDRLVVDLGGPASGYIVRYVARFRGQASNHVIPMGGPAKLDIIVRAPAVDDEGDPTYPGVAGQPLPRVSVVGYDTFRATRYGEAFEGTTQLGLGVRARLPFRVQKLGNRLVIDVAHRWWSRGG